MVLQVSGSMEKLLNFFRINVLCASSKSHEAAVAKTEFQRASQLPTNENLRPFLAQIDSPSGPSKRTEATNALASSLEVFSNISMPRLQIAATFLLESVDHVQDIFQDEDDLSMFAERMKILSSMVAEIDHQRRLSDYQRILDRLPNELHNLRNALGRASVQSSFKKSANSESQPNITREHTDGLARIIGELSVELQRNTDRTGASSQPVFLEQTFTLQSTSQAIRQRFDDAIIDTSLPGGGHGGAVGSHNEAGALDQYFDKSRIVTGGGAVGSNNRIVPKMMSASASPTVPATLPPFPDPPAPQVSGPHDRHQDHFYPHHSRHPDAYHGFRQHHPSYVSPSRDIPLPLNVAKDSEWSRRSEYVGTLGHADWSPTSTARSLDCGHNVPEIQDMPAGISSTVQEAKSRIQQTV